MPLINKKVLITAGPTIEMWDSMRYISNLSSGKTGIAIAEKAKELGGDVTLITTKPQETITDYGIIKVSSADDMYESVKENFEECSIFISTAAVCDFKPVRIASKIKKEDGIPEIKLEKNPDILEWAGNNKGNRIIVGFALEDQYDINEAERKMKKKKCDIMVLNTPSNIDSEKKSFIIITEKETSEYKDIDIGKTSGIILEECAKINPN